jgi:hypothetical protein
MKSRYSSAESTLKSISDVDLFKLKFNSLEELDDLLHLHIKNTEPLEHEDIQFIAEPDEIHAAIADVGTVGGAGDGLIGVGLIQSDDVPVPEYCSLSLKKKTMDKQIVCFLVTLRNQYRNLITNGEDSMRVEITGKRELEGDSDFELGPKEKVILHDVINNNDGTYLVSFSPGETGKYEISVMIDDDDVEKSPLYYYHSRKETLSDSDKLGRATSLELEKPNCGRM